MTYIYAPIDRFLILLLEGWAFPNDIAEPVIGHHSQWSTWMVMK